MSTGTGIRQRKEESRKEDEQMGSLEEHSETAHDRKLSESLTMSASGDFLHLPQEARAALEGDTYLPPSSSSYSAFLSSEAEKEIASASALRPQFPVQNVSAPRDLVGRKGTSRSAVFLGLAGLILFWCIFTALMVHQNLSKYQSSTQNRVSGKDHILWNGKQKGRWHLHT
jgi:hypothetical protein